MEVHGLKLGKGFIHPNKKNIQGFFLGGGRKLILGRTRIILKIIPITLNTGSRYLVEILALDIGVEVVYVLN